MTVVVYEQDFGLRLADASDPAALAESVRPMSRTAFQGCSRSSATRCCSRQSDLAACILVWWNLR